MGVVPEIKNNESTAKGHASGLKSAAGMIEMSDVTESGGEGFECDAKCNSSYAVGKAAILDYKGKLNTMANQLIEISNTLVAADKAISDKNK